MTVVFGLMIKKMIANKTISMGLPKEISQLSSIELTKLPNLKEVRNVLFRIDSNKTPRLDGF